MRSFVVAASLVASLFASGIAAAQNAGFAVNRFEPSERGSDWFANESLDLRGKVRPAIGIVGDYQYRPLAIYQNGDVTNSVVRNQLNAHVGASIVLFDRLRLATSLPVVLFTDGRAGFTNDGVFYPSPPREQGIGDLRFGADLRLLGEYGDAATLAIGAQLWVPTGDQAIYTTDGEVRVMPRAALAGDIGIFAYAARVGFNYRALEQSVNGGQVGSELVFGGAAGLRLADKKLLLGPEVFFSSVTSNGGFFAKQSTPVEGILGGHYRAGLVGFGAGVGTGLTRGFGSPEVRALLSVELFPEIVTDTDGDGILDKEDACPNERGVATDNPQTNGCPPPPDRDGDGVLDKDDACVDVAGVATNDPKTNGCPPPPPDRDFDGILDKEDACPDVKGVASTEPELNGCPDSDGDGIFDKSDACPLEAGIKTNDPKTNGCPDTDRDKDGILNDVDACPDEPGAPDPDPKKNGCPKAVVRGSQIVILDQVKFKTGSAEILPGKDSQGILEAVATILKEHPEIEKVRIEGHTDNVGAAAFNKKLSGDRAGSVVKWLVKNGVDKSRLVSEGFGMERPLASNATAEGKQANRRVEFHIEPKK